MWRWAYCPCLVKLVSVAMSQSCSSPLQSTVRITSSAFTLISPPWLSQHLPHQSFRCIHPSTKDASQRIVYTHPSAKTSFRILAGTDYFDASDAEAGEETSETASMTQRGRNAMIIVERVGASMIRTKGQLRQRLPQVICALMDALCEAHSL